MYCAYFNSMIRDVESISLPPNWIVTHDPDLSLDNEAAFEEARKIFSKLVPNEQFLPQVPNPEDIVWVRNYCAESDVAG